MVFPALDALRDRLEASMHRLQSEVETSARRLHAAAPSDAWDYLTAYTLGQQARANSVIRTWSRELPTAPVSVSKEARDGR